MKELLSSLIVASVVFIVSSNTSIAQEVKLKNKVEMSHFAIKKIKVVEKKSLQMDNFQNNEKLIARPVREKADIIAQPVNRRVEK